LRLLLIHSSETRNSGSCGLVRLNGRAAGAELLCLAARVLELRSRVGVDELPGLDPLEAVPL
jgi:hypothetical protein